MRRNIPKPSWGYAWLPIEKSEKPIPNMFYIPLPRVTFTFANDREYMEETLNNELDVFLSANGIARDEVKRGRIQFIRGPFGTGVYKVHYVYIGNSRNFSEFIYHPLYCGPVWAKSASDPKAAR